MRALSATPTLRFRVARLAFSAAVLSAATALSPLGSTASPAQAATEVTVDGMRFSVDTANASAGAQLTGYSGTAKSVMIPASVAVGGTDYAVRRIGAKAFYQKGLTAVTIPAGVTDIGDEAFRENALTSIDLKEGLKTLGAGAFGVNQLESLTIPSSVTSMNTGVFGINKIRELHLPANLTAVPAKAFISNELRQVDLPDSLTSIGEEAFRMNHLESISIPPGVDKLQLATFVENDLVSVTVPGTVYSLGSGVFSGNPKLTTVKIEDGVAVLGRFAFAELLTEDDDGNKIHIPCNITSLDLGNTLERIDYGAFQDCKLTTVTLPDSLEELQFDAFARNRLTRVDLGSGLKELGPAAFENNQLARATIPASVTMMGASVFAGNPDFTSAKFLGKVPEKRPGGDDLLTLPSTEASEKVTVDYYWRNGAAAGVAGGFTSPKWFKYPSRAIALVEFDPNGHGDQYAPSEVPVGERAYRPAPLTATGWTFRGWYADDALTTPFDFDQTVTRDLTAHARWSAKTDVGVELGGGAVAAEHRTIPVQATVGTVDQSADTPEGTVRFTIDGQPVGDPVRLDGSGLATAKLPGLDAGNHALGAEYTPSSSAWDAADSGPSELQVLTTTAAASSIEMTPSALTVAQGGSITVTVTASDRNGDSLGDVTDLAGLSSSVGADQISGSTIAFPTASPHTITATLGAATDRVTIQVTKASDPATDPDDPDDPDGTVGDDGDDGGSDGGDGHGNGGNGGVGGDDHGQPGDEQLPGTGVPGDIGALALLVGLALCTGGGLILRQRGRGGSTESHRE